MEKLNDFVLAYCECLLFSTNDESTPSGGEPLDKNYGIEDISPETLNKMIEDCTKFQSENAVLLAQAQHNNQEYSDNELNGHDFWLSRNGHGAGYFDRGLGEIGDKLQEIARSWGEVNLYVGDDGLIYL